MDDRYTNEYCDILNRSLNEKEAFKMQICFTNRMNIQFKRATELTWLSMVILFSSPYRK